MDTERSLVTLVEAIDPEVTPWPAPLSALERQGGLPDLSAQGFCFSPHGITPIGAPTQAQCFEAFSILHDYGLWIARRARAWQLAAGDLWNYMQDRWGEDAYQAVTGLDLERNTYQHFGYVSNRIPAHLREKFDLDYSYYREVCPCETIDERTRWLKAACDNQWSVRELRSQMHDRGIGKVKSEVLTLGPDWRKRADYLEDHDLTETGRAKAETYRQCADELKLALERDGAK